MKKRLTVVFVLMAILVLFCSCGKKYNGFKVEGDFIILPIGDELRNDIHLETVRVPLFAYKAVEVTLEPVLKDLVAFKPVSERKLERYADYEDVLYEELDKQLEAAGLDFEELTIDLTEDEYEFLEFFIDGFVIDYAWEVSEVLEVVSYYDDFGYEVKEVFDECIEYFEENDAETIKLWFPKLPHLTTYEKTGYAKEN